MPPLQPLLLLLLVLGRGAAQYIPGATTYAAPGAVGFTPNNIVVVRLAHPNIRDRSFSRSAAVFLDEFYAPNASDELLVLKQTIALPTSSDGLPRGQYALTTHGNDLQNIHSLNHGGMFNREYPRWRAARRPRPPLAAASANPPSPRAPPHPFTTQSHTTARASSFRASTRRPARRWRPPSLPGWAEHGR